MDGAAPAYLAGDTVPDDVTSSGIFEATPAEQTALQDTATQAITNTIADNHLAPGDRAAVQTWGRPAAIAELWALILKAAETPSYARVGDQPAVADWLTSVVRAEAKIEAYWAGLEFVRWADFNQNYAQDEDLYDGYISRHDWTDLQTFLSQDGSPFDGCGLGCKPYGYCNYGPPGAPDYEMLRDQDGNLPAPCDTGNFADCLPSKCVDPEDEPDFDSLTQWGIDDSFLNYAKDTHLVAQASAVTGASLFWQAARESAPEGGYAQGGPIADIAESLTGYAQADRPAVEIGSSLASQGFELTGYVLSLIEFEIPIFEPLAVATELATSIYEDVVRSEIPGELVNLIQNAQDVDVFGLSQSSAGRASLFLMFLGATLPQPTLSCRTGEVCMNAPSARVSGSTNTPLFVSTANGTLHEHEQTSFSYYDVASGRMNCVTLAGRGWFVDRQLPATANSCTVLQCRIVARHEVCIQRPATGGILTQTLSINYTDWDGHEVTAWTVPSGAGGWSFATYDHSASLPVPGVCLIGGHCGTTSQLYYQADRAGNDAEVGLYYGNGTPAVPKCATSCGGSSGTSTVLSWSPTTPTIGDTVTLSVKVSRNCPTRVNCLTPTGTVAFVQYRTPGGTAPERDITICSTPLSTNKGLRYAVASCSVKPEVSGFVYATFTPSTTNGTSASRRTR